MKFTVEIEVERTSGMNRSWEAVQEALEEELPSIGTSFEVEESEYEISNLDIGAAYEKRKKRSKRVSL